MAEPPPDEYIRESFERLPEAVQDALREAARQELAGEADEVVPPKEVNERALEILRRQALNALAGIEEFYSTEERLRLYKEEADRLAELHPEGFTEEAWLRAVQQRFKEEYPDHF